MTTATPLVIPTDPMEPFEVKRDPDGTHHFIKPDLAITVLPDVFVDYHHRNAVDTVAGGKGNPRRVIGHRRCLKIDLLSGIKVYVKDGSIIITKAEAYP